MILTLVFEDRIKTFGGEVRTVQRRHSFEGDVYTTMRCMEDWIKTNCAMFDVVRVFFEAAERGDRTNGAVMTVFIEDADNFQSWLGYVKEDVI